MAYTITVTADHIKFGKISDPTSCPIALAHYDAGLGFDRVKIHPDGVDLWAGGAWVRHAVPENHRRFVCAFDSGCTASHTVAPQSIAYTADIPPAALALRGEAHANA